MQEQVLEQLDRQRIMSLPETWLTSSVYLRYCENPAGEAATGEQAEEVAKS